MQKLAFTILTVFYLSFTSGLIINSHYCMDKLSSLELFGKKSETCSKCGMSNDETNGCCHDDTKVVKLQDDHFASYYFYKLKSITPVITQTPVTASNTFPINYSFNHFDYIPPDSKQPVYLVNKVFRI